MLWRWLVITALSALVGLGAVWGVEAKLGVLPYAAFLATVPGQEPKVLAFLALAGGALAAIPLNRYGLDQELLFDWEAAASGAAATLLVGWGFMAFCRAAAASPLVARVSGAEVRAMGFIATLALGMAWVATVGAVRVFSRIRWREEG